MSSNFTGHPLAEHFEIDIDKEKFKTKLCLQKVSKRGQSLLNKQL